MALSAGNQSEVAQLRAQIAREYEAAAWARQGLAVGVAQHRFITRRYERIGRCQEQLATMVGERASLAMLLEILEEQPLPPSGGQHERA